MPEVELLQYLGWKPDGLLVGYEKVVLCRVVVTGGVSGWEVQVRKSPAYLVKITCGRRSLPYK
jgi:hypothetical protein